MRTVFPLLLLALGCQAAEAQSRGLAPLNINAIYVEGFGNGGLFSLNYERVISPRLGLRAGFASWKASDFFGGGDSHFLTFPLTLSYLPGGPGSGWEFGGGFLLGKEDDGDQDYGLGGERATESKSLANLTAILGYRWVTGGGWMYRAGFTPFYSLAGDYPEDGFMPSVGMSFGKRF